MTRSSQCPLDNKHNLVCSVRAKALSPILYLTCTHRPKPKLPAAHLMHLGKGSRGMKEGLYIFWNIWEADIEKLMPYTIFYTYSFRI